MAGSAARLVEERVTLEDIGCQVCKKECVGIGRVYGGNDSQGRWRAQVTSDRGGEGYFTRQVVRWRVEGSTCLGVKQRSSSG